ncbi:hypothetical protein F4810DRAFT_682282 [Camillea tinctor]|nr:hypothetical protein F4810DRAFT_682282 [Camillea tinctor]
MYDLFLFLFPSSSLLLPLSPFFYSNPQLIRSHICKSNMSMCLLYSRSFLVNEAAYVFKLLLGYKKQWLGVD